jgi:hypothetical protein
MTQWFARAPFTPSPSTHVLKVESCCLIAFTALLGPGPALLATNVVPEAIAKDADLGHSCSSTDFKQGV